ncbi:MAG: hypothetical protein HC838_05260 [Spirulinaceae cyanobacterium RM2_2_10]|nr:hypothetical protein [Spirulinaceae cyanobacterium SM2_1_0]NJO19577.1 hypothetical protein [Spirulinaceae cyanobacterium RM2_2_10]
MNDYQRALMTVCGLALSTSLLSSCGDPASEPTTDAPETVDSAEVVESPPESEPEPTPEAADADAAAADADSSPAPAASTALRDQNYCLGGETLFHVVETSGFWVNICGDDRPNHYVGVSKSDGKNIRLPLSDYSADGLWYEAYNGNIRYQVSLHGEESPIALVVTDGDRVLVQQDVQRNQKMAVFGQDGAIAASIDHNYCETNESVFMAVATENFWLNICGGDLPNHYVGVSKNGGDRIRLPLSDYDPQGTKFTANNGAIRYEIFLVGDPESLVVTDTNTGDILVQEQILNF